VRGGHHQGVIGVRKGGNEPPKGKKEKGKSSGFRKRERRRFVAFTIEVSHLKGKGAGKGRHRKAEGSEGRAKKERVDGL